MQRSEINIIWFKKDLRLQDHAPLQTAIAQGLPIILLYCFEPSLMQHDDSDTRHWRFTFQSLHSMQQSLLKHNQYLTIVHQEVIPFLEKLQEKFIINSIFSHEEIGNQLTFNRDKQVKFFTKSKDINWYEFATNGITRGLKNRKTFSAHWLQVMEAPTFEVQLEKLKTIQLTEQQKGHLHLDQNITNPNNNFQPGGELAAQKYLTSFLYERKKSYSKHISKPLLSRKSCSRISPYLAYGNLSMKQVYQATLQAKNITGDKHNLNFFISRLHWHCHFIQKFESECRIEFQNLNKGFDNIRTEVDEALLAAWKNGGTGYPLVDACMQCVQQTGYLNFRMRSMLVSFLTHHLWQPWQAGVHHLAKLFLDYEPGIHYPQFQMQAGTMGVNIIRIYNPVKQSQDHDPDGIFIKQWLPQLKDIPTQFIHAPWLITALDMDESKFKLGIHYPKPIVNLEEAAKHARERLWAVRNSKKVKENNISILQKHTKRKTEKEEPLQLFGSND